MREIKNLTPSRILDFVIKSQDDPAFNSKGYTYVILGKSGPTGKTWLCHKLKTYGFNAIEISEDVLPLIEYNDDKNHIALNGVYKTVVIVLNKKYK